ncbi:MAG: hypothetical protein JWN34_3704 [Bryobacterales bacterium]|nr:hypothetical protein [Bryobacterales bacterium]
MPYFTDNPKCPKCDGNMRPLDQATALPESAYLNGQTRTAADNKALPLEVHFCDNCRFIELFAG